MKEISICKILEKGNIDELYKYLDYLLDIDGQFLLDFAGIRLLNMEDITNLISFCMRLRNKGCIIKIKNVPLVLRRELLLSGLNYVDGVITF